jgi:hypothetical protein
MKRTQRDGVTLIEIVVAAGLFTAILGGAWALTTMSRRQGEVVTGTSAQMRAIGFARAQLEADLATLVPAYSEEIVHGDVRLREDGRAITFHRIREDADPEAAPPRGGAPVSITWVAEELDGDQFMLVRRALLPDGEVVRGFADAPLSSIEFRKVRHANREYVAVDLTLAGRTAGSPEGMRLRVLRPLAATARLPELVRGPTPMMVREALPEGLSGTAGVTVFRTTLPPLTAAD